MNRDLTLGKPGKVLWQFCLPLFASMIFQQLYNIADSYVAGKFIGEDALAAVGVSYEVTLIFIAFAFGCNIGCSVITAQLFGAKRYNEMKTAVYTTLLASGALCLALMAAGYFGSDTLLRLIHTPDNILADSKLYLHIYILGLPFVFCYNISTGIFSAMGDAKTPFRFLACSSTCNIAVDILFVTVFRMGVAGVAWATFLCQGVSCILALLFVLRRLNTIQTQGKVPLFSWDLCGKITAVAVPSILQQSFVSVGNILIQGVINTFGSSVVAGYSAAVKLNNLFVTAMSTLGNGISNYTAQNLGAKKPERIPSGTWAGLKMVWALCVPIVAAYLLVGRSLVYLFMDEPTGLAMDTGVQYLRIISPFYFVIAPKMVMDGVLRGAGRMAQFMTSTFTDLLLRVGLAYLLSATALGVTGVWLSWPIGWIAAAAISTGFYVCGSWRRSAALVRQPQTK